MRVTGGGIIFRGGIAAAATVFVVVASAQDVRRPDFTRSRGDGRTPVVDTEAMPAADPAVDPPLGSPPPGSPPPLVADVRTLSSDAYRGRGTADDSIDRAAAYIAGRMRAIGLNTDIVDGSPMQPVDVPLGPRVADTGGNRFTVRRRGVTLIDATAAPVSGGTPERAREESVTDSAAAMSPLAIGSNDGNAHGPIVFLGYGIRAPELGYDEYQSVGIDGCVAIILRGEPRPDDPASPFDGTRSSRHALFVRKVGTALARGAAAVVLVNDAASVRRDVELLDRRIELERRSLVRATSSLEDSPDDAATAAELRRTIVRIQASIGSLECERRRAADGVMSPLTAGSRRDGDPSAPVVSIGRRTLDRMLAADGRPSVDDLQRAIDADLRPRSFFLRDQIADVAVSMTPSSRVSPNVIGVIPGRGPLADQDVVVGAHYDHVGMGGEGSLAPGTVAVHNGADDNASGVAAMLETARRLRPRLADTTSHRRVVFVAFTGEERGLAGSAAYVDSPLLRRGRTVAMINLDMVGRLRDRNLTVYGTASGDTLDALVTDAARDAGVRLTKIGTGYGPSDHRNFYRAGVPVLFFFTGLHDDYHRPSDDFDKINFTGLARVTEITVTVVGQLATADRPPRLVTGLRPVPLPRSAIGD